MANHCSLGEFNTHAPADFNEIRILPAMETANRIPRFFHFTEVILRKLVFNYAGLNLHRYDASEFIKVIPAPQKLEQ